MADKDPPDGISHINRALPTSGHRQMYNSHKYFARKQEDVISEYVKHYSKEDEIVLDPFCGSGVHISEAVGSNRKGIGIDINPASIFISRNTVRYVEPSDIKKTFRNIEKDVKSDINSLYTTTCRDCGIELAAICFTWDNGGLQDVRYECPQHGEREIEDLNDADGELYEKIENGEIDAFFDDNGNCKYFYPTNDLYYPDGTPFHEKQQYESVDDIFTKRNTIALAKLLNRIEEIDDEDLRESFKFAFSSMLHLASRMTPVRPSRPFSSAWTQHSYWSADNFMEQNVWTLFERAVLKRQSLLKAKEDMPKVYKNKESADTIRDVLNCHKDYIFNQGDAIAEVGKLDDNSIDYVLTDPPYGESIQYAELLFMWETWLGLEDDFDNISQQEIVVNPKQKKGEEDYENMLYAAFRNVYEVLKPGRYCTITFHNPKLKYRNILFRAVVRAGFEFEKIVYQPPPRPSAKGLLQPFGSLKGDYFFRYRKPEIPIEEGESAEQTEVDKKRVEQIVVDKAKQIIAERGEPTHYTFIQNVIDPALYEELRKYGLLMDFNPENVEDILNNHIGDEFALVEMEVAERNEKSIMGKGWWFSDPSKHKMQIPLNKRVDEAISNLLRRERVVDFTDVLTEVYTQFENSLTPEEQTIKDILEENATKEGHGQWRIKPFVQEIGKKHEEMVYYLAELGLMSGYQVDIADDEYAKVHDGKRLENLLDITEFSNDDIPPEKAQRIDLIDVLWHDGDEIIAEFEVEHSTSIVDAIVRGSNIENDVIRLIVIPEEREELVSRKFKEPAMQDMMQEMQWAIITYSSLKKFYEKNHQNDEVVIQEFLEMARQPMTDAEKEEKWQESITDY